MNKKKKFYLSFVMSLMIITIPLISVGYSALQTTLNISGDFIMYEKPTLYSVLKRASTEGIYAMEYNGSHRDSMAGVGDQSIYYWYAPDTTAGQNRAYEIVDKYNVIFANHCWKMYRTTDTGGVKLFYNGLAENGQCLNNRSNHVGYNSYSVQTLSSNYWYGTSYQYDDSTGLFSLSGALTQATWNNSTASSLIGKYTCKSTSSSGTCSSLYLVESYNTSTKANTIQMTSTVSYSNIGSLPFNINKNSIASVGYMYNNSYDFSINQAIGTTTILFVGNKTLSTSYYYADSYTYDGSTYTLENPFLVSSTSEYNSLAGKYTFLSTSSTYSSNTLYYIAAPRPNLYLIQLENGNDLSFYDDIYTYGSSYTDNGNGTYTINNPSSFHLINWGSNHTNIRDKFVCKNATNNTCSDIWYINQTQVDRVGYITKISGNYKYGTSFSYDSSTGMYTLSGDVNYAFDTSIVGSVGKYTCWNLTSTCSTISYILQKRNSNSVNFDIMHIDLSGGQSYEDIMGEILYADDVNTNDSFSKFAVDNWYKNNLMDYQNYIEDVIYCGDRSLDPVTSSTNGLWFTSANTLNCSRVTDRYSVSNNKAKLKYPVGLATYPEMNLLGMYIRMNFVGSLMSPRSVFYDTSFGVSSKRYVVFSNGLFDYRDTYDSTVLIAQPLRPVISLLPDTEYVSGDGSMANPYVVDAQPMRNTLIKQSIYTTYTFGKEIARSSFESITTVPSKIVPNDAIESWDVSSLGNGAVMAWYKDIDSNGKYELYIGQDGGVVANPDSSSAFNGFTFVKNMDLSYFDTTGVINMSKMFNNVGSGGGNQSGDFTILGLSMFDTSQVTDMSSMFYYVGSAYSGTVSLTGMNYWDVSKVESFQAMFSRTGRRASTLAMGDLSRWNPSSALNMSSMFYATGYNTPTFNIGNLGGWDVSSVSNMNYMFRDTGYSATTWSIGDLSLWNTSGATTMIEMFASAGIAATNFNLGNLNNWNLSGVRNTRNMFSYAGNVAQTCNIGNLSSWNVSSVTDMSAMFQNFCANASTFNLGNLGNWNVSSVQNMWSMFAFSGRFSSSWYIGDLSGWTTSSVENMTQMFQFAGYSASTWSIGDIGDWDVSHVTNFDRMFDNAGYSATSWSLGNIGEWDVSSGVYMNSMFESAGYSASTWSIGNLSNWNTASSIITQYMFYQAGYSASTFNIGDISGWNMSHVTDMNWMFASSGYNASTWYVGSLSTWNTSSVETMERMFWGAAYNASTFNTLNLSNWDFSHVTTMSLLFSEAGHSATNWSIGTLTNWTIPAAATLDSLFYDSAANATNVNNMGVLNIYSSNISSMFNRCNNAKVTINLYNNPSNYFAVFYLASTLSGSEIVVNYTSAVTSIDNIIATKDYSSNVVKGSLIN